MRLAVAIADTTAIPSAFVVWRGFEDSIRKAAEYGYHGVELALKTAEEVDRSQLSRWLAAKNLEVSCISTGQVFAALGLYFTHPDPAAREKAVGVFAGLIDLATDFSHMINVGRTRGFIGEGETRSAAENRFLETAGRICEMAARKDVTIIIEPVNRYEINFINSVDEGAAVLQKMPQANIGLMPDVFHMNIEDDHIGDTLARHGSLIKYIHFADSNRHAPGWGHLDFDDVFSGLRRAGFDGWASIEILPVPDPDSAARQAAQYILPRIAAYNAGR
jgi:sugar phosphate isomerase/epimerase